MKSETLSQITEILDFLGNQAETLMPKLHEELSDQRSWPVIQTAGLYLHHFRAARRDMQTGGNDGADFNTAHSYALAHIMEHPVVQGLMAQAVAFGANRAAGVE